MQVKNCTAHTLNEVNPFLRSKINTLATIKNNLNNSQCNKKITSAYRYIKYDFL